MHLNAARRIEDWLLHSDIQIRAGAEAGAVAGWLTEHGEPSFAYPEITGYYLTCMAFVGRRSPGAAALARERAGRAAEWLARSAMQPTPPPTRQHLHPQANHDWRNAAVFAFDLAMVLRGIAHAAGSGAAFPGQPLLAQYARYLFDLCTPEGALRPVKLRDGHRPDELPCTWSTGEGIHHVKTAAAILAVPDALRPARLSAAAQHLLGCWVGEPWQHLQTLPLHPLFYYLEGLASLPGPDPRYLAEAARVYAAVMRWQDKAGFLPPAPCEPPAPGAPDAPRSDVIAQALRMGSLLKLWGYLPGGEWEARLESLARALLSFVGPDGGVSQHPLGCGAAPLWNAWCSMFSYQAFVFYGSLVERKAATVADDTCELLI